MCGGVGNDALRPADQQLVSARRGLTVLVTLAVTASEMGKIAWARLWLNRGFGYWWVGPYGFSVGITGCGGQLLDAGAALLLVLFGLDLALALLRHSSGGAAALALHALVAVLLCVLAAADLALAVGAGGARVSLPLVLFVLSEPGYVFRMVQPWLHIVLACSAGIALVALAVVPSALRLLSRTLPRRRLSWYAKVAVAAACGARLFVRRRGEDAVSHDLMSQLAVDAASMARGSLRLVPTSGGPDVLRRHTVELADSDIGLPRAAFPPLLLFHWEAGMSSLLQHALAANRSADSKLPFLRSLAERSDTLLTSAYVTVPMTLKSAWEALCGTPPALTSDFREHASALRRECLPRVLARCCGYHSILVKTDTELPELPRRVFGFQEVIVAPTTEDVLAKLRRRLAELGGLSGERPVFVYFYAGDAHAPYEPSRVRPEELGLAAGAVESVYLALSRRADQAAASLARFWPPPRSPGEPWRPEHGLAIYFGDHGELLWEDADPPPHGNSVAPAVTQALLAVERRSFASTEPPLDGRSDGGSAAGGVQELHRMADIFSTVAECVGLSARGPLHVGESLLRAGRRSELASFSFYRPSELLALHRREAGSVTSVELVRSPGGWSLAGDGGCGGAHHDPDVAGCSAAALPLERLREVLDAREAVNALVTESNVHAAWLFARLATAARHVLRAMLGKWLPAPPDMQNLCNITSEGI